MKTPTLDRSISGLYVGYKDINPPYQWYPLALLTWDESEYHFQITQIGFQILDKYPGFWMSFPECEDGTIYRGQHLPMVIQKRMPWGREDDRREIEFFFDSNSKKLDGIASLARNGGLRSGDPFDICPLVKPSSDSNIHQLYFSPDVLINSSDILRTISTESTLDCIKEEDGRMSIFYEDIKIANCPDYVNYLNFTEINLKIQRNDDKKYLEWRLLIVSQITSINLYDNKCFEL